MHPDDAKAGGNNLKMGWQIIGHFGHIQPKKNIPTPTVSDQYTGELKSSQQSDGSMHSVTLAQIVNRPDLPPTPTTQDGKNLGSSSQMDRNTKPLNAQVLAVNEWGQFAPAIQRWEQVIVRKAPPATESRQKDGKAILSAKFTEWVMGLPEGHVTDPEIGISRNDQLKACGNGVVPQQAALALRYLLGASNG